MPKHSKQKSGGPKQQRAKAKPYQSTASAKAAPAKRSALKQQAPTLKHKQTAATVAKALGHCGIDSLLADTAAELQEKGIKLKCRSKANKGQELEQQQQQQQQQQHSTQLQEQQRQQQRQQQQQLTQQQQPHVAAPAQPDLMSMLGSWSVKQPGEEQQQQPVAV
jgi:hypothetical protein